MIRTKSISCNLCGSKNASIIYKAKDLLHGVEGQFDYVKCNDCGLVYMNPQVITEDLPKIYPDSYAPHYSGNKKQRFGLLSDICNYLMTMAKIKKSVYNSLNKQSRVLDIGCGAGSILNRIRNKTGCEVYGVDISENAVQSAKEFFDIDVFHGDIKETTWPENHFDVITAWQYLEHVPDPNQNIEKMASLLKNNGTLILGVPNNKSLNAKIFKSKWYPLDCPRHLCIWSPQTMKMLLEKYGLEVEDIVFDITPWGLIGSLQYLVFGDNVNPKTKNLIAGSRIIRVLLFPWTILLGLLKCSDGIIVYAKKIKK